MKRPRKRPTSSPSVRALEPRTLLAGGPSGGRFGILVSDMDEDDSDYCSVTGWTISGTDLVVTVICWFEETGEKDDDAFYLFVFQ